MKTRPNVVLAAVTGLVIVLAIVAGVLATRREPPKLDEATPEGTVQLFVLAVIDGDDAAAVARLDPELGCEAPLETYRPSRVSMSVVSSRTTGQQAQVVLEISEYSEGGFLESWSHRESYELVSQGSGWLITGNPWPVYSCE
ncbi:MAG: hypothetical protein ACOX61_01690 [Brooklawnia sp.]|jgi:hypothetical protein